MAPSDTLPAAALPGSMPTATASTERRFRAMGADAHVVVVGGGPGLADLAVLRIATLEQRWSRFRADSEVTALNDQAGAWVAVSEDTRVLILRATEAWRLTGGRFDPTVLGAVREAGYDASFELLAGRSASNRPSRRPTSLLGCDDVEVLGHRVRLPAGAGFDPGGIGKGLAADLVVAELLADGADGACVNLGGDLRVAGIGPSGGGWTIAVDHPWAAAPIAQVGLVDGAVATSTTLRRHWTVDGEERHHLIDPGTGLPSTTDLTLVSVVAGKAWMAEVLAKAVLLRGAAHPFDLIEGSEAAALVVDDHGRVRASDAFAPFLGGVPVVAHVPMPAPPEAGPDRSAVRP